MSLNYFYCKVKNLKWDRWQNFTVSCLKALQRLSFYSDLSFKKKEICSAFLECNVFTTNLRELLVCLVFSFRVIHVAIAVQLCIVRVRTKAQFPARARLC